MNYNCQSNKTLTATYSNASASCSVVSNYSPSYTGVLSDTPSSLTLIVPSNLTESIDLWGYDATFMVELELLNSLLVEDMNSNDLNPETAMGIFYGAGVTPYFINPEVQEVSTTNDLINDWGITTLPLFTEMNGYTVTYTATSATNVTITVSDS